MGDPGPTGELEHLSDDELWLSYIGGADGAFAEVRRRYEGELYWYLVLSLASPRRAAEQLAKVLGLAAAYRFPHEGFDSLKGWLYAIATQTAAHTGESEEPGLVDMVRESQRGQLPSDRERLMYAIFDLGRRERQPLLLVTVGRLSVSEAAGACNFTTDQTVTHIRKGLRELAACAPPAEAGDSP